MEENQRLNISKIKKSIIDMPEYTTKDFPLKKYASVRVVMDFLKKLGIQLSATSYPKEDVINVSKRKNGDKK